VKILTDEEIAAEEEKEQIRQ